MSSTRRPPSRILNLAAIPGLFAATALLSGFAQAQDNFNKDARPPVDVTKERTLYVVGYAHLDTQWRWTYPQVIREFIPNTLLRNFALFEKYPNYVFNFSGSRRYEMMKEYYPADYQKLKGLIAEGRWFPCGSSVDEGDAIVPSLESMVRHVLYGNRYFKQEFGVASNEFMLPDCFGFPASLPSILAHCGIKGFSTQKLTWGSANGIPFNVGTWSGPDGSSILAALDPGNYSGSVSEDLSHSESWLRRIEKTGTASGAFVDYKYYGTGDRGGAPGADSVKWIERSVAGNGPVRVISSNAEAMFNAITPAQKAKLPNYNGELLLTNHSAGSITSQAYMKRWNRKSELLADSAERASVAALWMGGAPYPAKKLYDAWDLVLGSQMHDMLPGTSVPKAYEYCWNDFILAQNQFAAVAGDAAAVVISAMDTTAKGIALVVYNPLSIPRVDVVEADVTFPQSAPEAVRVTGPDGKETPAQVNRRDGVTARVVFLAQVPSVGFATYDIQAASAANTGSPLKVSECARTLENARYRVTLNESGDIASILDKTNSRELLSAPARLSFQHENPAQYPAWNMDWQDRQKPSRAYVEGPAKVRAVESGPVRVALEIERDSQGSHFLQQIRLATGESGDMVQVVNKIDWKTRESSLKAAFPLTVSNPVATYDDKLGVVTRGNNEAKRFEAPQHEWFALRETAGRYGVAVLNDCKYGSDKPNDNTMRLTLLYTPGVRGGFQDQSSQDIGHHDMTYAISGHAGDWNQSGVAWQGSRLNQPLLAFQTPTHPGKLGRSFELVKLSSNQVELSAMKKAEAGDEIVVRLRELNGNPAKAVRLTMPGAIVAAREIDGQERPVAAASLQNGELITDLPGYGLRAFALKLSAATSAVVAPKSQPVTLAYDLDAISSDGKRTDGGFDREGRTYPAEQLPPEIVSEGIPFKMGPVADGAKNAMVCRGQTIELPVGSFNRVYLLASAEGDAVGSFVIGDRKVERAIQDWSGYIGQWDNRLWNAAIPMRSSGADDELHGLVPGYTKRDTVAWYASHVHHPKDGNEFYQYCYLFKYGFDVAPGTTSLTLPNNDKIRVFAVTVARNDHDNATAVTIAVNYWQDGGLHYTVDASEPTASSPVYSNPLVLETNTTLKARMIFKDGKSSPVASATFEVHDVTAPVVESAKSSVTKSLVLVAFSKPVTAKSAEVTANYRFEPPLPVLSAKLAENGKLARLMLGQPVADGAKLTVSGVEDRSPSANRILAKSALVTQMPQTFSVASMTCDGKTSRKEKVERLPSKAGDAWTINLFVRTDEQPENHTVIAGFGAVEDRVGKGRYLAKFGNGIHFWSASRDGETRTPLDIGKWQMLSASYDGDHLTIYKNANKIGETDLHFNDDAPVVHIAPIDPWEKRLRFKGDIRDFAIWNAALSQEELRELVKSLPK